MGVFKYSWNSVFSHDNIPGQGVCLIEAESSRRTDAVHGPDEDGSYDYGLFQINSRYWCSTGATPGMVCNLRCDGRLSIYLQ